MAACTEVQLISGNCTVESSIEGDEAVLEGNGSGSSEDDGNGSGSGSGSSSGSGSASGSGSGSTSSDGSASTVCTGFEEDSDCDPRDGYTVTVITLADIARFRSSPGTQHMEPGGWVVLGLPANIYSEVGTQVVPGELLDQPAEVRFTPIRWVWDYGDGSTASLSTPGASWATLGLREFDRTATSHSYLTPGDYTIRLNTVFRAEYRINGGSFTRIAGTLTLPTNDLQLTVVGGANTVLVDRDCTRAPSGPGC